MRVLASLQQQKPTLPLLSLQTNLVFIFLQFSIKLVFGAYIFRHQKQNCRYPYPYQIKYFLRSLKFGDLYNYFQGCKVIQKNFKKFMQLYLRMDMIILPPFYHCYHGFLLFFLSKFLSLHHVSFFYLVFLFTQPQTSQQILI